VFIGHVGVALAAKRVHRAPSVGTYLAAAQWPDFLWAVFLLLGWETARIAPGDTAVTPLAFTHYPWSHSLLADLGWAALLGAVYRAWRRDRRGAIAVGLLVASHWLLDAVAHRPDLPLLPGSATVVGLGLWRSRAASVLVEGALLAGGVALYVTATPGQTRGRRLALAALVALLAALYGASVLGPPPPRVTAIAVADLAGVALVLLAAWIDRRQAA
jgi:membrane-bound metal-dependent hydrolase YbcI (DUF457 family)